MIGCGICCNGTKGNAFTHGYKRAAMNDGLVIVGKILFAVNEAYNKINE